MKARAHTAVLLLTLALLALPAHVRTQQQEPVVLRYRGIVYPGDTFAPHLYDLHFDGVNQYVAVPKLLFSYPMTICLWVKPLDGERRHYVYASKSGWDGWGPEDETHVSQFDGYFSFFSKTNDVIHVDKRSIAPVTADWHFISVVLDSTYRFYLNGSLVDSVAITGTPNFSTYDAVTNIGKPVINIRFMYGLMSVVLIYSRALTGVEISNAMGGVVNASGLRLFIDPTFFDGTKYVDLSGNGNHAYPYNDPLRVPAERPFLWVVRGLYGDGVVRFRFVPRGWHVVVRDATGAEVLHLDTSYLLANAAGLVDEVRLDIVVPGVYEVVLSSVYPLPGEVAVGFGESLLVYSLAGACVVLPVVVAGSRRFELAAVVSSVYFATVFLYLASGSSVGTWGVALSLAGLSVPLMFLLSLADLRRFRAEPAAVASVTLAAVLHLVSLGVAAGYGVVPVELGVAYASATVLLWVALVVFGAVRKGLGVVRRVVVVE